MVTLKRSSKNLWSDETESETESSGVPLGHTDRTSARVLFDSADLDDTNDSRRFVEKFQKLAKFYLEED